MSPRICNFLRMEDNMVSFESNIEYGYREAVVVHNVDIINVGSKDHKSHIGKLTIDGKVKQVAAWSPEKWNQKLAEAQKLWPSHGRDAFWKRQTIWIIAAVVAVVFLVLASATAGVFLPASVALFIGSTAAAITFATVLGINCTRKKQWNQLRYEIGQQYVIKIQGFVADRLCQNLDTQKWEVYHALIFINDAINAFTIKKYQKAVTILDKLIERMKELYPNDATYQTARKQWKNTWERLYDLNKKRKAIHG